MFLWGRCPIGSCIKIHNWIEFVILMQVIIWSVRSGELFDVLLFIIFGARVEHNMYIHSATLHPPTWLVELFDVRFLFVVLSGLRLPLWDLRKFLSFRPFPFELCIYVLLLCLHGWCLSCLVSLFLLCFVFALTIVNNLLLFCIHLVENYQMLLDIFGKLLHGFLYTPISIVRFDFFSWLDQWKVPSTFEVILFFLE